MNRNPTVLTTISILLHPLVTSHYIQIFPSGLTSCKVYWLASQEGLCSME